MTKREQGLALGFGAILIIGIAFVGLTQLRSWKQRVDLRSMALDARLQEATELLAEKETWDQRAAWLAEKQPEFTKRSETELTLLNLIRDSASRHDVTIDLIQPRDPSERAGLTSATMVVQAKGELGNVLKWLHGLQEPTSFISLPTLTMLPNEEDTRQVTVNMTVHKWFRLPPA